MIPANPYDDMPSCEEHACDLGGCREPWAWTVDADTDREWRACEAHAREALLEGAEHRRDEGDDVMAEERAERDAAWRERGW